MNPNSAAKETTASPPNGAGRSELNNLIADLEDVLARAGQVVDVDVAKLRDGLRQKLARARAGLAEGGRRTTEAARAAAGATDDYVHGSPWQAIGIAAMVGAAVGYLVARR